MSVRADLRGVDSLNQTGGTFYKWKVASGTIFAPSCTRFHCFSPRWSLISFVRYPWHSLCGKQASPDCLVPVGGGLSIGGFSSSYCILRTLWLWALIKCTVMPWLHQGPDSQTKSCQTEPDKKLLVLSGFLDQKLEGKLKEAGQIEPDSTRFSPFL